MCVKLSGVVIKSKNYINLISSIEHFTPTPTVLGHSVHHWLVIVKWLVDYKQMRLIRLKTYPTHENIYKINTWLDFGFMSKNFIWRHYLMKVKRKRKILKENIQPEYLIVCECFFMYHCLMFNSTMLTITEH